MKDFISQSGRVYTANHMGVKLNSRTKYETMREIWIRKKAGLQKAQKAKKEKLRESEISLPC